MHNRYCAEDEWSEKKIQTSEIENDDATILLRGVVQDKHHLSNTEIEE